MHKEKIFLVLFSAREETLQLGGGGGSGKGSYFL